MPEKFLQLVVRDLFTDFGLHIADVVHRCLYTLFVCLFVCLSMMFLPMQMFVGMWFMFLFLSRA